MSRYCDSRVQFHHLSGEGPGGLKGNISHLCYTQFAYVCR